MFSLKLSFFIIVFLCVPFLLKKIKKVEPYPAVIYPSGAATVKVGLDSIDVAYTIILAKREGDKWQEVDAKRLINPIPIQNLPKLISNGFGIKDRSKKNDVKENARMTREAKLWLKKRLSIQGYNASEIKISKRVKTLSVPEGEKLDDTIVHETTLELN